MDFFGALRARIYDDAVRQWVEKIGLDKLGPTLVFPEGEKPNFDKPNISLDVLIEYGDAVVEEQENVKRVQLADSYLSGAELAGMSGTSLPE